MTPQDIREKIFEKAVFGGYDMGSVDDFMEEMASELEAAQRESATLKAKMKVLVDKIEEYRASEDAIAEGANMVRVGSAIFGARDYGAGR